MKESADKMSLLVGVGLVVAILVLAFSMEAPEINVSSQAGELRDTMSVSGTSSVSVAPDEAEVYINVITEADDAKTAQTQNADISAKVRNALKNKGVRDDDIETYNYYLYPKTSWNSRTGQSDIYGYKLTNTLKITTKDIQKTGDLVDAAVAAGANGLDNVNFRLSDELRERTYKEALEIASVSAKGKADSMASALGVRLDGIVSVSESGASYVPYRYDMVKAAGAMESAAAPTVISPQEIDVSAYVSVVYAIE